MQRQPGPTGSQEIDPPGPPPSAPLPPVPPSTWPPATSSRFVHAAIDSANANSNSERGGRSFATMSQRTRESRRAIAREYKESRVTRKGLSGDPALSRFTLMNDAAALTLRRRPKRKPKKSFLQAVTFCPAAGTKGVGRLVYIQTAEWPGSGIRPAAKDEAHAIG